MIQIFLNSNLEYENVEKRYFIEGDQLSIKENSYQIIIKKTHVELIIRPLNYSCI